MCYPNSAEEAEALLSPTPFGVPDELLLQQRVVGDGVGVFALCEDGRALTTFCHRRILEKPPSGGRSVLSESIPMSAAPVDAAHRLLAELKWSGIAMVEFKQHTDGRFYLMEINPRFWGSLQLAVDAGRDFPKLLTQWALAKPMGLAVEAPLSDYQEGIRLRWTLGTLDHLLIRLKASPGETVKALFTSNPLQLFRIGKPTRAEVLRYADPTPALSEVVQWFRSLVSGRS